MRVKVYFQMSINLCNAEIEEEKHLITLGHYRPATTKDPTNRYTIPAKIVGPLWRFLHIFSPDPPTPPPVQCWTMKYFCRLSSKFGPHNFRLVLPTYKSTSFWGGGRKGGREARTGRSARATENTIGLV